MAFGISFGTNKTNNKGTQTVDTTTTQNQNESGTKNTSGTTTSSGSTTQSGTTSGTQTQTSTGTNTQTGVNTGSGSQNTSLFSSGVLQGLEGVVGNLLGTVGGPATVNANYLSGFDPNAFVANGLAAARAKTQTQLDEATGSLYDTVGGSANTNSAVALLENRLRGDADANLAGIQSQLTGQAQDIVRSNVLAGNQVDSSNNQFLATLLDVLKGGNASTSTAESNASSATGASTNASTGTSSESNNQTQQTQTTTIQNLVELMSQLLSGTSNTKGTTTTNETSTKSGGGFSLGL